MAQRFELTSDYVVLVFEIYRAHEPSRLFGVFDSYATATAAIEASQFHTVLETTRDGVIVCENWWGGRVSMAMQPARVQTPDRILRRP